MVKKIDHRDDSDAAEEEIRIESENTAASSSSSVVVLAHSITQHPYVEGNDYNDDNDNTYNDDDDDNNNDNYSYEQESLGLVYSVNSSIGGYSDNNMIKRTGSYHSNSGRTRSPFRIGSFGATTQKQHRKKQLDQEQQQQQQRQTSTTIRQQQQQDNHHLENQRWRRLPIADDDYLDDDNDDDDLNNEWNHYEPNDKHSSTAILTKRVRNICIGIVLVSVLAVLIPRATKHTPSSDIINDDGNVIVAEAPRIKGTPQYTCPVVVVNNNDNNNNQLMSVNNDKQVQHTSSSSSNEVDEDNNNNDMSSTSKSTTMSLSTTITDLSNSFMYYDDRIIQDCDDFASNRLLLNNDFNTYINTFRNTSYIPCGNNYTMFGTTTYNEIKNSIRQWKLSKFLGNLKTGDSIYHSGSGIGLNLLLTLELLQEASNEHYITDLHVYGNDHRPMIAQIANVLLDTVTTTGTTTGSGTGSGGLSSSLSPLQIGKRGVICSADSLSLHTFVPDLSFDLVYASAIPALPDPLELNTFWSNYSREENQQHMNDLCSSSSSDSTRTTNSNSSNNTTTGSSIEWKAITLIEIAQQRQNNWYASWVTEMIRIAKADTPVIIEYVGQPYCTSLSSQSTTTKTTSTTNIGVAKSFWKEAIIYYNWNIDIDSVTIVDDELFPLTYHVFMKTKKSNGS